LPSKMKVSVASANPLAEQLQIKRRCLAHLQLPLEHQDWCSLTTKIGQAAEKKFEAFADTSHTCEHSVEPDV